MPEGTLADILGPKQTGISKKGLALLIKRHGIKGRKRSGKAGK